MGFGFAAHFFHLGFAQAGRGRDGDVLAASVARSLAVTSRMPLALMSKTTSFGNAARGRRNAVQRELAQGFVIGRHGSFALQHVNFHLGLVVGGG
jgi:hypothetical protein